MWMAIIAWPFFLFGFHLRTSADEIYPQIAQIHSDETGAEMGRQEMWPPFRAKRGDDPRKIAELTYSPSFASTTAAAVSSADAAA